MHPKTTIRPYCHADADAITAIYADAVLHTTATYEETPPTSAEMHRRLSALIDAGFPCFVAETEIETATETESETEQSHNTEVLPVVAGYTYAGPFRPRPAYRFTVEHSVYVAHHQRGRGVGRLLLEALVAQCGRSGGGGGFRQMVGVIGEPQANRASVALHERMGFREVGRIEGSGYKFGRWLDTLLVQRAVGDGVARPPET
ncbi:phosphinotricin acetyltransferase [Chaetomium strumarium]|uniref:Phosphinotricin acetyltransferase n=1 Tax=Chaetomium strumarium TaxID=1170767 RepID=A0AAJ0GY52_9PEZI|nr:phosphinotricin acetyltransferase [Chaetomium strumarium]